MVHPLYLLARNLSHFSSTFLIRTAKVWDVLPASVVIAKSNLGAFKKIYTEIGIFSRQARSNLDNFHIRYDCFPVALQPLMASPLGPWPLPQYAIHLLRSLDSLRHLVYSLILLRSSSTLSFISVYIRRSRRVKSGPIFYSVSKSLFM